MAVDWYSIMSDLATDRSFFLSEDDFRYGLTSQLQKQYPHAKVALEVKPWTWREIKNALSTLTVSQEEKDILEWNLNFARFTDKTKKEIISKDSIEDRKDTKKDMRPAFDIWMFDEDTRTIFIIELKYLTKEVTVNFGGANFLLKCGDAISSDGALFIGDMVRMELVARMKLVAHENLPANIENGYNIRTCSVILTNIPTYWVKNIDRKTESQHDACLFYNSRRFYRGWTYHIRKYSNELEEAENDKIAKFTFANTYEMKWHEYSTLKDSELLLGKKKVPRTFQYLIVEA